MAFEGCVIVERSQDAKAADRVFSELDEVKALKVFPDGDIIFVGGECSRCPEVRP